MDNEMNKNLTELTDEELNDVNGGAKIKVNGTNYTVVTSGLKCFTGQFVDNFNNTDFAAAYLCEPVIAKDHKTLRALWSGYCMAGLTGDYQTCGNCANLSFKAGTGYCSKS